MGKGTRVPADAIIDKLFAKFPPKISAVQPVAFNPGDGGSPESGGLAEMFMTSTPSIHVHGDRPPALDQLPSPLVTLSL